MMLRLFMLLSCFLLSAAAVTVNAATKPANDVSAIEQYVHAPDDHYKWRVLSRQEFPQHISLVLKLTSQQWLSADEVNRPIWEHTLSIAVPKGEVSSVALLYIGGGSNQDDIPQTVAERMAGMAIATGSVTAELGMVPNQPLEFHGDGIPRYEDDLIGYTWDQFLKHGEARWLARNPMIKSAVKAMDAVSEAVAEEQVQVDQYVVAGGSKRGWTTWLTGALDERVIGIAPIVIDLLNVQESMQHHFEAYGFWAIAIGDYVDHKIMPRFRHPRVAEMYALIDPYNYRHRLDMPKLLINAAGDQFFLPDSAQFYFDDMRGENYLRYVPNADHSLAGTDAMESLTAFLSLINSHRKPPQLDWQLHENLLTAWTRQKPERVLLWQMTNADARDFRTETQGRRYTSQPVALDERGQYSVRLEAPEQGWTASFLEFEFDVGATVPLKLTTQIYVTPDVLPFAGKPLDLPNTFTVACEASDARHAQRVARDFSAEMDNADFASGEPRTVLADNWAYLNWTPSGRLYAGVDAVRAFLKRAECTSVRYQLESGDQPTLPPQAVP